MLRILILLIAMTGCATAQTGETQPVTWDDVEGLRLSSLGYRASDDPCRRAGESALTVDFLDDAADLVACPSGDPSVSDLLESYSAKEVGRTETYTLFTVPRR